MTRLRAAAVMLALLGASCMFRDGEEGPVTELTEIASRVETATYAAVYRFGFTKQFGPGVSTRLEIVQEPPVVVRKVTETTTAGGGKPVALTAWYIRNEQGSFACNNYPNIGVRCTRNPIARTTFGSAKIDIFFDPPRQENAFASVRKASRTVRIQNQQATCYEAVPAAPTPVAASPRPTAERFRYELCYAEDGILLRGRRTNLDEDGAAGASESFVEAVSVTRIVEPAELRLPGPVVNAEDLPT